MFENLEVRRLLSVSFKHGQLIVTGTEQADRIVFKAGADETFKLIVNHKLYRVFRYLTSDSPGDVVPTIFEGVRIDGRGGDDRISLGDLPAGAIPGALIYGGDGDDLIVGSGDDDTIRGGNGDDRMFGQDGHDQLNGGLGGDLFDGGAGRDRADYGERSANLDISTDGKRNDGERGENDNVLRTVEVIFGGSGDDLIVPVGGRRISIYGRGGDDTIRIRAGEAFGGVGNDTLINTTYLPAALFGGAGNDTLIAEGSSDVFGGDGDDHLVGSDGNDYLNGGDGNNTLEGKGGNDFLRAGHGHDIISGGDGVDSTSYADRSSNLSLTLDGIANDGEAGENDNLLDVEQITGGQGDDLIVGDNKDNRLGGEQGADTIHGGGGDDYLFDGQVCKMAPARRVNRSCFAQQQPSADQLFGDDGNDVITAYVGNDSVYGGNGDDLIDASALAGAKVIDGGDGDDEAYVNADADTFTNVEKVFDAGGEPIP